MIVLSTIILLINNTCLLQVYASIAHFMTLNAHHMCHIMNNHVRHVLLNTIQTLFAIPLHSFELLFSLTIMGVIAILIPIHSTTQLNDSTYVPKSKRWTYCRKMINGIAAISSRISSAINNRIQTMDTHRACKKIMRDRRQIAERMSNNRNYVQRHSARAFLAYTAFCFATQAKAGKHDNAVRFDTDSASVGIDNCCSACISHVLDDFEGPMIDTDRVIKGYGGTKTYNLKNGYASMEMGRQFWQST